MSEDSRLSAAVAFYVLLTDPFGISTTETRGAEEEAMADFLSSGDITCWPQIHNITKSPIITDTRNRSRGLIMQHARTQLRAQIE